MIYTDINFHKILSILNTLKDNQLNKMNFLIKIYILYQYHIYNIQIIGFI